VKKFPTKLEPVLAKIANPNDLGSPQWYEVVYYLHGKWCSYSGSDTFKDGEQVVEWKYCSDIFKEKTLAIIVMIFVLGLALSGLFSLVAGFWQGVF
jgi:hypothetical protein